MTSSALWSSVKSAAGTVVSALGLSGRSKDDGIIDTDDDSMGPVMEDGEELSDVMFHCQLDSCPEDSVVVRSVG